MTSRVLVVGSANVDVVLRLPHLAGAGETVLADEVQRGFGGKGANQAVAAVLAGASVALVGRLGDDAAGAAYRRRLAGFGIDVTHLLAAPGHVTGTAYVLVDRSGENSIVVDPGANAAVGTEDLSPVRGLRPGDVLLLQCELPPDVVGAAVRLGHEAGATVVLNLAPYLPLPADVLARCAAVVVNEAEAAALGELAVPSAALVVTRGAAGATWGELDQPGTAVPVAEVVDTTGAGDAFCGALAAALAAGRTRGEALAAAVAAGAEAVRRVGAQPDP
jgi:ribokinase